MKYTIEKEIEHTFYPLLKKFLIEKYPEVAANLAHLSRYDKNTHYQYNFEGIFNELKFDEKMKDSFYNDFINFKIDFERNNIK